MATKVIKATKGTATTATSLSFADRAASPAGQAAIALYMSKTGGVVDMVKACIKAFDPSDAEGFLLLVNKLRAEAASKKTGKVVVPEPIKPVRKSELNNLLKLQKWDCYEQWLDGLAPIAPAMDTLVRLGNWFRNTAKVEKKGGIAPSMDDAVAYLGSKKADKDKVSDADKVKARAGKEVADMLVTLGHLSTVEGKGDGAPFLVSAIKALTSYLPRASKIETAADYERAEKKKLAKLAAKVDAGK